MAADVLSIQGAVLPDHEIRRRAILTPFVDYDQCPKGVVSYGLSSCGYDIRLAEAVFVSGLSVDGHDVKAPPPHLERLPVLHGRIWIPPRSRALGESVERFDTPPNVVGLSTGKSSYCRQGLIVNVSPQEPGWRGVLTIALVNPTDLPIAVYPNEGITQIVFACLTARPERVYGEKGNAKYQDAATVDTGRVA